MLTLSIEATPLQELSIHKDFIIKSGKVNYPERNLYLKNSISYNESDNKKTQEVATLPQKKIQDIVSTMVHENYWINEHNCATTTLIVLSELFDIPLNPQVLSASRGMHGAGKYGAQCGLVEGTLMFIGIIASERSLDSQRIETLCYDYACQFVNEFGSLLCRELRPEGFKSENPPHLCEDLTIKSILFSVKFISTNL